MIETFFIRVLEFLYESGIKNPVNIYPVITKLFPKDKDYGIYYRDSDIKKFLENIKDCGFINYRISELEENINSTLRDFKINAELTIQGFEFVTNFKTNRAVRRNSKHQTWILIGALGISIGSLGISILNYVSKPQPQLLLLPKEVIKTLKANNTLPTNPAHPPIKEKVILKK